jgi:hypothetical protein
MNWLIDRRQKSIAVSAQRVTQTLHQDLQAQKAKNADLEGIVAKLQSLATRGLQDEILRLELRRKELLLQLEETDDALQDRKFELEMMEKNMRTMNNPNAAAAAAALETQGKRSSICGDSFDSVEIKKSAQEVRAESLEEEYLEETEMLRNVKDTLRERVLFVVHSNNVDDVIVYFPTATSSELITAAKLEEHEEMGAVLTPTSNLDTMMSYGPQIVPNHERDFPHVRELAAPNFLSNNSDNNSDNNNNHNNNNNNSSGGGGGELNKGHLLGAVKLPLIPDVIIDIWRLADGSCWATTTIDNTSFCVLERIFVSSEMSYSVSVVVAVDIFGRNAAKGFMLHEEITE